MFNVKVDFDTDYEADTYHNRSLLMHSTFWFEPAGNESIDVSTIVQLLDTGDDESATFISGEIPILFNVKSCSYDSSFSVGVSKWLNMDSQGISMVGEGGTSDKLYFMNFSLVEIELSILGSFIFITL